jgi:hypothetical protein
VCYNAGLWGHASLIISWEYAGVGKDFLIRETLRGAVKVCIPPFLYRQRHSTLDCWQGGHLHIVDGLRTRYAVDDRHLMQVEWPVASGCMYAHCLPLLDISTCAVGI